MRGFVLLIAAFVCVCAGAAARAGDLDAFRKERAAYAAALAEPIAACVARRDTSHPVFRGCIDWHSAAHGVWALIAYGRITGDRRYDDLVRSVLDPALLAREREDLRRRPGFEMPYGRAWFLRLAVEYERAFDDGRLSDLADDVARSLVAHYERVPPDPASIAYESASWALINLHEFAAWRGDRAMLAFVEDKVRKRFVTAGPCPLRTLEVETREFMAVCTNRAWLVGKVLEAEAFKTWLASFLPAGLAIEPVRDEASVHQAGLNFSRAWGLWHLYRMTGEARFRDAYLSHFRATFDRPEIWRGDYGAFSHWVAQFGMLALAVSRETEVP